MGKHGKIYGNFVREDSKSQPGKHQKSAAKSSKAVVSEPKETPPESIIPVELQQLLLNIFRDTFPALLSSDQLQPLLSDVKSALYARDFVRAFGKQEFLEAYTIRWSPSRSLCYVSMLVDVQKHLSEVFLVESILQPQKSSDSGPPDAHVAQSRLRVACFGGGAAEVVAFGGFLRHLRDSSSAQSVADESEIARDPPGQSQSSQTTEVDLLLIDVAQWDDVTKLLHQGLITPPPLSKYANAAAREANASLLPEAALNTTFMPIDILEMSQTQLAALLGDSPILVTLLFTLNELYTSSMGKTTAFLLNLTATAKPGTILLVVDSPGSYSEATIGSEAKKYPMQWLMDHTLLEPHKSQGQESTVEWVKLASDESKWFRLPESLRYPIALENMRYQIHLYRRT